MDKPLSRTSEVIEIDNVIIGDRLRRVDPDAVARLRESINEVGLLTPITVRMLDEHVGDDGVVTEGALILVAGLHRLTAYREMGMTCIEAFVETKSDVEARLAEIAENLHRAELSAVERAEQIDEWRRLTLEKVPTGVAPHGGQQRNDRGHNKTAEALGVSHETVRRAEAIAALPQEVRDAAREEGWSQKKLLDAAKPSKPPKVASDPLNGPMALEKQVARLMDAWNAAAPEAREEFLGRIDAPVMDGTRFG